MEKLASALSILLMGFCGVQLFARFIGMLRGQEKERLHGQAPGSELAIAALCALASRVLIAFLAYAMYRMVRAGSQPFMEAIEPLWVHWDARHYLGIAQDGYTAVGDDRLRLVFFPLYSALMRLVSPLFGGNLFAAGTAVSLLCASGAAALVYDLAYGLFGKKTARLALAYFLLNPMSVFLGCVYTESLFIFLTLAAVCLLRRGKPWLAALCGMLSALTRMPGAIVSGLFIIALLAKIPKKTFSARAVMACLGQVLIVFCGLFIYWGINYIVTGDPMMYLTYQRENWFQQAGSFWQSTSNTMHYVLHTVGEDDWLFTWGFQLAAMFYVYVLLAFGQKKLPFDLAAYSFVYVAAVLAPTWLLSGARYLYGLCVLPLLQARMHRHHGAVLASSTALLVVFTFGYAVLGLVF